jgi:glycine reductase
LPSPELVTWQHRVNRVESGGATGYDRGVLTIDVAELVEVAERDPRVRRCRVETVRPGDPVRLIHVLDSVRPVCSSEGTNRGAFPGLVSPVSTAHRSNTIDLDGVMVTAVGMIPAVDSFLTQQEGILDLDGPGARLSPLAEVEHVVLHLEAMDDTPSAEVADAFRRATMLVAERLAATAIGAEEGEPRAGRSGSPDQGAIRLVHICEVSAFGKMFDTLVMGKSAMGTLPTPVSLPFLDAGGVVSADYHYAGQRNLTCFYQRSPIAEAVSAHSPQTRLVGTILLPVGGDNQEKERGAAFASHLASALAADGALITAVAGGNAHLDVMFAVRECEKRGIRSALSLVEMAGPLGSDPGMVDTLPEADLIISTGNREQIVALPPIEQVLGGSVLLDGPAEEGGGADARGNIEVPLRSIVGVNNEMGAWTLGARAS